MDENKNISKQISQLNFRMLKLQERFMKNLMIDKPGKLEYLKHDQMYPRVEVGRLSEPKKRT